MVFQDVDLPPATRRALEAFSFLSRKWYPVVLAVLADREDAGFNDLLESIPDVSGKVLSDTLDALRDAGLVERTVISESPLRVEYGLTSAGEDIEAVFDELATWSEQHLEAVAPTVLVAEADRRITEMYSNWLAERYEVTRAHDREQVNAALVDGVDVILVASRIPGVDPSQIQAVAPTDTRTILLVDERPDFGVLDVECDDVLTKPLLKETTLDAIDRQLSRQGETADQRRHGALSAKRDVLERVYSAEKLTARHEWADLCSRIEVLEARLDGA